MAHYLAIWLLNMLLRSLSHAILTALSFFVFNFDSSGQPKIYDAYASRYDAVNGDPVFGIQRLRGEASQYVEGNVLETCIGTALQSKTYVWDKISSFTGIDESSAMLQKVR